MMEEAVCNTCGVSCRAVTSDGLCGRCRSRAKQTHRRLKINPRCECGVSLSGIYKQLRLCSRCSRGLPPLLQSRPAESNLVITPPEIERRIRIYQDRVARREAGEIVPELFAGFERDLRLEHGVKDGDES